MAEKMAARGSRFVSFQFTKKQLNWNFFLPMSIHQLQFQGRFHWFTWLMWPKCWGSWEFWPARLSHMPIPCGDEMAAPLGGPWGRSPQKKEDVVTWKRKIAKGKSHHSALESRSRQMVTEIPKRKWVLLTEKVTNDFTWRSSCLANMTSLSGGLGFPKFTVGGTIRTPQRWLGPNPGSYFILRGKKVFADITEIMDLKIRRLSWII